MKKILSLTAAAAVLAVCAQAEAQTKWDMPMAYPATNFHTINAQKFADAVKAGTGGRLTITIHANASLFKANEIKRAVQTGQAQIGEVLMVNLQNEDPVFGADGVPFLATDFKAAKKLADAAKPIVEKKLGAWSMNLLYAVPWPPQGIYANKELNSLKDMEGLKWRAYSPATARLGELVKAQPITIQAAELSQALATGKVNSFVSSGSTGVDAKVWESLKYFYDTQAWLPKNLVIVSQKAFDALDKPTQEAVLKAAAEAEARGWKTSEEKTKFYLEQLAKNGMKVEAPSAQLKADMKKVGDTMTADWARQAGADGQAVLDAFRK